jgi:ubiquitin-protein ligase
MTLSPRILKEIKMGLTSTMFDFFFDAAGAYGEKNNAYLRFIVQAGAFVGQTHILRIKFNYGSNQPYVFPKDPPNVVFETPIYHTNIAVSGSICLDVIQPSKWSALYGLEQIFTSIIALLDSPNTSSPFNCEAARVYKYCAQNPDEYYKICIRYYQEKMKGHASWRIITAPEFETSRPQPQTQKTDTPEFSQKTDTPEFSQKTEEAVSSSTQ